MTIPHVSCDSIDDFLALLQNSIPPAGLLNSAIHVSVVKSTASEHRTAIAFSVSCIVTAADEDTSDFLATYDCRGLEDWTEGGESDTTGSDRAAAMSERVRGYAASSDKPVRILPGRIHFD